MYTLNGNKLKFESQFRCFIEKSSTVSIQSIKGRWDVGASQCGSLRRTSLLVNAFPVMPHNLSTPPVNPVPNRLKPQEQF